jgi:hypothetical protein
MRLTSLTLLGLVITVQPTFAEAVDLALVLAADVSGSVDQQGFELQRQGYAAARSGRPRPAQIEPERIEGARPRADVAARRATL